MLSGIILLMSVFVIKMALCPKGERREERESSAYVV
jgi:hypothetical protein